MAEYRIARFSPDLLGEVAELRRAAFGHPLARCVAYVDWMYVRNPWMPDPPLLVALRGGAAVAMRGTIPTRWTSSRIDGHLSLPSLTDTCVLGEHRDAGLYAELTEQMLDVYRERGLTHVLNLTPTPENFVVSTVATGGFVSVGRHDTLVRRARLSTVVRAASRLRLRPGSTTSLRSAARGARGPTGTTSLVDEPDPRPSAMADLLERVGSGSRLRPVRDVSYLQWRFENPFARHRFLYAERGSELVGYAVLQTSRIGSGVDVVDLEAVDSEVRTALLDRLSGARVADVRVWSSTLADVVVADLAARGFVPRPRASRFADRFIVRALGDESAGDERWSIGGMDIRRMASWDLRGVVAVTY